MGNGIVVDANVMNEFTKSLINKQQSPARQLIDSIRATHGFVIDSKGQIQQQWRDTCGMAVFGEWLFQALREGLVRMVDAKIEQGHKKNLFVKCGFPQTRYEITYVAVAINSDPGYIVTEDIDFWEPAQKKADEKTKAAIKQGRTGTVYKYLTKKLEIAVGTISQAFEDLGFSMEEPHEN